MKRLIAIAALCASLATVSFAQNNSVFDYGHWTAMPGTGEQIVPFALRFTPDPTLPHLPNIGGGAWRVTFDTRYVDLQARNAAGTYFRASTDAPADGSIRSWGLVVRPGPGLSGTFAAGIRRPSPTTAPYLVDFLVSVLPTAPDNTVPNTGYFQPFFQNRNTVTPLPEFVINWPAIQAAFGLFNPYRLVDFGSFAWQLNEQGTAMDDFGARSDGSFTVIPEPASMIALGSGLVGLLALRRRRKA